MTILIDGPDQILHQWDKGQRLLLVNVEGKIRVDFARCGGTKGIASDAYAEDGNVYCDIPDTLLMENGQMMAYVRRIGDNREETVFVLLLNILPAPKPGDYVEPEEVLRWYDLEERISELEKNGISEDKIAAAVEKYLEENPPEAGVQFETDETLRLKNGILSVNTADRAEQDNTLPITSAAVHTQLGNIETLLKTI